MSLKVAIAGFRHPHIMDLVRRIADHPEAELVAAFEDHAPTRQDVEDKLGQVSWFEDFDQMLAESGCDAVGIGDYYARRGSLAIAALKSGKHVVSDKPLCTSLEELDQIESLAREKGLSVGCQLDLRDNGILRAMRQIIQSGEIGEVHAISFNGQHPLNYGKRAGWYFEEGKHGGTINDIAIHALDFIPWLTGLHFTQVDAARNWHTKPAEAPHFLDAAQLMMTMNNGCGVQGDVSYFAPDSMGYGLKQYWRTTIWGSGGMMEAQPSSEHIVFCKAGEKEPRHVPRDENQSGGYFQSFVDEVAGRQDKVTLSTAEVIHSARVSLLTQQAADSQTAQVQIPAPAALQKA